MVKEKKPKMVFVMETKLHSMKLERIHIKAGFGSVFGVDSVGRSGGLALFWADDFSMDIQNYSRRHINVEVRTTVLGPKWKFTGFYGNPEAWKRYESWSLLRHISTLTPSMWLCIGDFNEIVEDAEKYGVQNRSRCQMEQFISTLEFCHLHDLGFFGPKYMWRNRRDGRHFIIERLDRAVGNPEWFDSHPGTRVDVLAARSSVHAAISISLLPALARQGRGQPRFRFEAAWNKNEHTREILRKVWRIKKPSGDGWGAVQHNLEESKKVLLQWRRINDDPVEGIIKQKTRDIKTLQEHDGLLDMDSIRVLQQDVSVLMEEEELKWRQRAKELWLKEGDKNTQFFHACASQRKHVNMITQILDEGGNVCSTTEGIQEAFIQYYDNLFTSTIQAGNVEILEGMNGRVSAAMNAELTRELSTEEI